MATTDFIAAIELSSSKISGIAGKKSSDGSIQVLAYAREDASPFIHKGAIYNIDKAAQALTSIINKLEGQLNNSIAKVYVGIGGQSLRTVRNAVSRTLEEESIISQELVDEICDENRDVPLVDMSVLDVAPQEYKIDNTLHVEPVGVAGRYITGQFPKIVAHELNLPLEKVFYDHPDTSRVPDSGPTVASRSLMTVGELLRRAAIKLRTEWKDGEDQIVEEKFVEPDFMIPFYLDKFRGDAYPTYAWGAQAIEVEVDTYTGLAKILGAYASFDVGTPMDYNIVMGQMEGGFLQGIGYASTEFMNYDNKGRIRNNSFSDYLIPTAVDVPVLNCQLHVEEYPFGPYGAKGAGELPLVGAAPAYVEAIEQALGGNIRLHHAPFTAEDTIEALAKEEA